MDAIDVEERDTKDRERTIVGGVLSVGHAVVEGEGVAVEVDQEADALADPGVPWVGHPEEHGVAEQERRQILRPARRVGDRERSDRGVWGR